MGAGIEVASFAGRRGRRESRKALSSGQEKELRGNSLQRVERTLRITVAVFR